MASRPGAAAKVGRLARLMRDLSFAIGWAMAGLALMTTLRLWSAGSGLLDLIGNLVVAFPSFGLFALTVWRHRRTLAAAVAGSKPRSRWQGRLARIWPGLILGFLIVTFLSTETRAHARRAATRWDRSPDDRHRFPDPASRRRDRQQRQSGDGVCRASRSSASRSGRPRASPCSSSCSPCSARSGRRPSPPASASTSTALPPTRSMSR